jgi:hypothetical protein
MKHISAFSGKRVSGFPLAAAALLIGCAWNPGTAIAARGEHHFLRARTAEIKDIVTKRSAVVPGLYQLGSPLVPGTPEHPAEFGYLPGFYFRHPDPHLTDPNAFFGHGKADANSHAQQGTPPLSIALRTVARVEDLDQLTPVAPAPSPRLPDFTQAIRQWIDTMRDADIKAASKTKLVIVSRAGGSNGATP